MAPSKEKEKLNKTEKQFLGFLMTKSYAWLGVQCITLKLADDCRYTPDFISLDNDGAMTMWEVKGFMRDDALVKLKVAARNFPMFRFKLVHKENHGWCVEQVSS